MLHYQYFTAVFVKMYKIHKHGGFSGSQSHIDTLFMYVTGCQTSNGDAVAPGESYQPDSCNTW